MPGGYWVNITSQTDMALGFSGKKFLLAMGRSKYKPAYAPVFQTWERPRASKPLIVPGSGNKPMLHPPEETSRWSQS